MLHPVSRTFHARDVFSPATGHLAAGMPLANLGPALDPADLVRRVGIDHELDGSLLTASVQHVDRFGNIQLAVFASELDGLFEPGRLAEVVTPDDRYYVRCAETFADVDAGELVLYKDSSGLLSVAVNRGSAAELTATRGGRRDRRRVLAQPPRANCLTRRARCAGIRRSRTASEER